MKSGKGGSDWEAGIGVLLICALLNARLRSISVWPLIAWLILCLVVLPFVDKMIFASSFHHPVSRQLFRIAFFLIVTAVCFSL